MNRLEGLIEALKETDRHIEALVLNWNSDNNNPLCEARDRADLIAKAIVAEKGECAQIKADAAAIKALGIHCDEIVTARNIFARELAKANEANNTLEAQIVKIGAERDEAIRAKKSIHADLELRTNPNPALENVLEKLRIYTKRISPSYKDSDVLNSFKAKLTLGDLRRWVESEVIVTDGGKLIPPVFPNDKVEFSERSVAE